MAALAKRAGLAPAGVIRQATLLAPTSQLWAALTPLSSPCDFQATMSAAKTSSFKDATKSAAMHTGKRFTGATQGAGNALDRWSGGK